MTGKNLKRPRDANQLAKRIVDLATGNAVDDNEETDAARLGRVGGKKGGPARAAKLSPERRAEIARKAAQKRWEDSET
jgi:hypothetical protein